MQQERTASAIVRTSVYRLLMLVAVVLQAAVPAASQAQDATPAARPVTGTMQDMFGLVPAQIPGLEDIASATIAYADIAAQLDAVGVTPPDSMDSPGFESWATATRSTMLPSPAQMNLRSFREDYGFDLLQVDQTLWVALPPFELALYRGRFDTEEVRQALDEIGYQPVEVGGHEVLSIRGDFEQDLQAPTAYKFAGMNFATILDDGTLVFASAGAPLAAVLDVVSGTAPSMLDVAGVSMLLQQAPDHLASALLVQGVTLAGGDPAALLDIGSGGTPDISAIPTEMAERSEMPPVVMALLGTTVGGPAGGTEGLPPDVPEAGAVAVLLMLSPEAAERAAGIIEERLTTGAAASTGEPYAAMFPERTVQVVPDAPVVTVELTLGEGVPPNILANMLFSRDLGFLAW